MDRTKLVDKQQIKRTAGKCRLCPESRYELLDVHRIVPGEVGGDYSYLNSVVLCANCHRRVHKTFEVKIDRYYFSTAGYLLRIIDDGEERYV